MRATFDDTSLTPGGHLDLFAEMAAQCAVNRPPNGPAGWRAADPSLTLSHIVASCFAIRIA